MVNYYSNHLNANKLRKCYEVAPPRVQEFLDAEIEFVLSHIHNNDTILDLGCGYGRVAVKLAEKSKKVVGIDISKENIQLANDQYKNERIQYFEMNAVDLSFEDNLFDITICIQNGISAFKVDPAQLIKEALRVTKKTGMLMLSSYSEKFWEERLKWFQIQAEHRLIGEIDYDQTRNGTIICKDGFKAVTYSGQDFLKLASNFDVDARVYEVNNSSVFCQLVKR